MNFLARYVIFILSLHRFVSFCLCLFVVGCAMAFFLKKKIRTSQDGTPIRCFASTGGTWTSGFFFGTIQTVVRFFFGEAIHFGVYTSENKHGSQK